MINLHRKRVDSIRKYIIASFFIRVVDTKKFNKNYDALNKLAEMSLENRKSILKLLGETNLVENNVFLYSNEQEILKQAIYKTNTFAQRFLLLLLYLIERTSGYIGANKYINDAQKLLNDEFKVIDKTFKMLRLYKFRYRLIQAITIISILSYTLANLFLMIFDSTLMILILCFIISTMAFATIQLNIFQNAIYSIFQGDSIIFE